MPFISDTERVQAEALIGINYCNPFLPDRIEYERQVLGDAFAETDGAWHKHPDVETTRPNIERMTQRAKDMADGMLGRMADYSPLSEADRACYENAVLYFLYNKYEDNLFHYIQQVQAGSDASSMVQDIYARLQEDLAHYFSGPETFSSLDEPEHLLACFFQLRRAFHHIFDNIIGGSRAATRLRAAVWESIFTCDVRRYRRTLFTRMGDVATLITGPSGTGKELVARAIGLSRYVPFDPQKKRFTVDFMKCFYPVNLSALSPTLIESELFGHAKGSFTGAVSDRIGFFDLCPAHGTVFLDEIGELEAAIQVKLLRVLHTRTFQRIGDTAEHCFRGKVIAATNRDLVAEMKAHNFREDFYYRLCSDVITTPSLREQLENAPEQLHNLLLFITKRVAGEDEAEALAREVQQWIGKNLDPHYAWPGNVRELEQCVRNIMVRRAYTPARTQAQGPSDAFLESMRRGELTADEMLEQYCTLMYAKTGSYQEAARRLGLDRRTVKSKVNPDLLAEYEG